jgi:LysR family nitrogen assimilation transcriptional regulator
LFERHRGGVRITEAGTELLRHAREIVARFAEAEVALHRYGELPARPGRLHLAIISSIAARLTPMLLEEFARVLPGVALRISEAATQESREWIDEGKVDCAMSLAPFGDEAPIAWERLYLVSGAQAPFPGGKIPFAALAQMPLILPARDNPLREILEEEARRQNLQLNVVVEIDGPGTRANALLSGKTFTVLGGTSTSELTRSQGFAVRPIVEPDMRRPLYIGTRDGLTGSWSKRVQLALLAALGKLGSLDIVA